MPAKSARSPVKNLVECNCSQCGPSSAPISRTAWKAHLQRDTEKRLRASQKADTERVPAGAFMAAKRKNPDTAVLPQPDPTSSSRHTSHHRSVSTPNPISPPVLSDDVEMTLEQVAQTQIIVEPASTQIPLDTADTPEDIEMLDVTATPSSSTIPSTDLPPAPASAVAPVITPSRAPSTPETLLEPRESLAQESPYWFWQLILITVAWLHLHWHTPHRACTLLLKVLRNIFICLSLVKATDELPITLTTTFKRLGLNEDFEIRAVCPLCRRAYPENSPADLMCSHCHIPLFNAPPPSVTASISLLAPARPKATATPRPVLQSPYLLPSTQIIEFLNREGNEIACESYLTRKPVPGKMNDIQDGNVCQSLKGPDGRKFFETGPDRPDPDELRIGLCFGEDGFAFTRSKNAGTHTSGAASFCVTGLPHHTRFFTDL
ncbi:hypothetical protein DFH09DRAFT_1293225 [Mycena vulgaris]|nr:hypothetical protein DFH09DRAFT_1293225 [Mycena vulgaris]